MTEHTNGSSAAKTQKELLLEHDDILKELREEVYKTKTMLYVAVALGIVNVAETLISVAPTVAAATVK